MINQAKQQYSDDSFMYLLWGWLVFAASMGQYILDAAGVENSWITWMLMPVGGILMAVLAGWVLTKRVAFSEMNLKSERQFEVWRFLVKYLAPLMLLTLFFYNL